MLPKTIALLLFGFILYGVSAQPVLSDPQAHPRAAQLYDFLGRSASQGILFGHQDDLSYGVDWWDVPGRSDVKDAVGSYPAVFGWDVGVITSKRNIDSVLFKSMLKGIHRVYKMGGINTISWHMVNPENGASSWDKSHSVPALLPGGKAHQTYLDRLDRFADFIGACQVFPFQKIPIVFRPFHEHNGDWFWWGKGNCTEQEYIDLWRFTVDYLRNEKNLHQLIYAFSPDRSRLQLDDFDQAYLYGYPGDDYVDILGLDDYWDVGKSQNKVSDSTQHLHLTASLQQLGNLARSKQKIAALTETGLDGLAKEAWYTQWLLEPMQAAEANIAWVLVWRNSTKKHHYVPYEGHPAFSDFRAFEAHSATLFLRDITNPYK
ncbi:glycoside hydrolase family 26 protein [Marinoscillum furvescens]|uniref:Mannan endo-1,4-beta-mannosidase n=1 Tax=Marinoscillum furvescens DSM 4134 TaxID=1122208 RepID=A0A3D9L054_MARFU|nr:glycosyl hydrolase [Marinoscillum furvescens]RED95281.1 mannan endo-1,4-beta-mannosidase [Marinoscillum furvescens DSM 4134]